MELIKKGKLWWHMRQQTMFSQVYLNFKGLSLIDCLIEHALKSFPFEKSAWLLLVPEAECNLP
jgi:hypothetical protein